MSDNLERVNAVIGGIKIGKIYPPKKQGWDASAQCFISLSRVDRDNLFKASQWGPSVSLFVKADEQTKETAMPQDVFGENLQVGMAYLMAVEVTQKDGREFYNLKEAVRLEEKVREVLFPSGAAVAVPDGPIRGPLVPPPGRTEPEPPMPDLSMNDEPAPGEDVQSQIIRQVVFKGIVEAAKSPGGVRQLASAFLNTKGYEETPLPDLTRMLVTKAETYIRTGSWK